MDRFLNLALMRNPLNWVIVTMMLLLGLFLVTTVAQSVGPSLSST